MNSSLNHQDVIIVGCLVIFQQNAQIICIAVFVLKNTIPNYVLGKMINSDRNGGWEVGFIEGTYKLMIPITHLHHKLKTENREMESELMLQKVESNPSKYLIQIEMK